MKRASDNPADSPSKESKVSRKLQGGSDGNSGALRPTDERVQDGSSSASRPAESNPTGQQSGLDDATAQWLVKSNFLYPVDLDPSDSDSTEDYSSSDESSMTAGTQQPNDAPAACTQQQNDALDSSSYTTDSDYNTESETDSDDGSDSNDKTDNQCEPGSDEDCQSTDDNDNEHDRSVPKPMKITLVPRHWRVRLQPRHTWRWNRLITALHRLARKTQNREVANYLEDAMFRHNALWKTTQGVTLESPMSLAVKMEKLLMECQKRRTWALERIGCSALRPVYEEEIIEEKDMQHMFNDWQKDVNSWMREDTKKWYFWYKKTHQGAQASKLRHNGFKTFLHLLSGSKNLAHVLIKYPIIDQCDAATLQRCIVSIKEHMKKNPDYQRAVERSKNEGCGLSRRKWQLSMMIWQAKSLCQRKERSPQSWKRMVPEERQLCKDYENGLLDQELRKIEKLRTPAYKGVGPSVHSA